MDVRELRIGNTVEYLTLRNPDIWDVLNSGPSTFGRMVIEPERYRGIPLTEDWLIRFGFEVNERDNIEDGDIEFIIHFPRNYDALRIQIFGDGRAKTYASVSFASTQPCEYVHQLQNLYFALTGTELELSQKQLTESPTAPEEQ